jgi:hypothetical protein
VLNPFIPSALGFVSLVSRQRQMAFLALNPAGAVIAAFILFVPRRVFKFSAAAT